MKNEKKSKEKVFDVCFSRPGSLGLFVGVCTFVKKRTKENKQYKIKERAVSRAKLVLAEAALEHELIQEVYYRRRQRC